jgi:hypothetical protein
MVSYAIRAVRAEVGASWIGNWIGYDRELITERERAPRSTAGSPREYWREYDDVFRPHVLLSARVGAHHAFARIDNFGNANDVLRDNLSPTLGRTVVIGIARQQ